MKLWIKVQVFVGLKPAVSIRPQLQMCTVSTPVGAYSRPIGEGRGSTPSSAAAFEQALPGLDRIQSDSDASSSCGRTFVRRCSRCSINSHGARWCCFHFLSGIRFQQHPQGGGGSDATLCPTPSLFYIPPLNLYLPSTYISGFRLQPSFLLNKKSPFPSLPPPLFVPR